MAIIKLNNRAVKDATAFGSITGLGNLVFISRSTASSSSSLSITSGIDSTYKEYRFYFNNIHPSTDDAKLLINFSSDTGSNYNVTKTTTFFNAQHRENGSGDSLGYRTGADLAQSTSAFNISEGTGNDNDQSSSGELILFSPSSDTFVKHFLGRSNTIIAADGSINNYFAGYCNTTDVVDAVQFSMDSGNIDSGTIDMYGVK